MQRDLNYMSRSSLISPHNWHRRKLLRKKPSYPLNVLENFLQSKFDIIMKFWLNVIFFQYNVVFQQKSPALNNITSKRISQSFRDSTFRRNTVNICMPFIFCAKRNLFAIIWKIRQWFIVFISCWPSSTTTRKFNFPQIVSKTTTLTG